MKTRLISGIIMMMALVACTQEEMLNNEFGLKKLKTEVEGYHTSSRVGFTDKDAAFFWTKGDKIGVTTSNSSTFQGMTLSGDGGSATGDFSGSMSGNPSGYAVYPYGQMGRHSVNNDELTYTLPASYTYKTLDATYAKADGNSYNAPMWGKVNNGSVSFKHLSGVIAFEVNGLPENTSGKFILTASNKINGTFTANLKDSEPVITSEATDVPAEKTITISFTTAEGQNKGYFYVPVPIGSLGNLMLAIVDGDENEIASGAWDNITINRKDIKRAVIGEQSITGGMVREIEGIDEITNEILTSEEEELIVQITEEVSGTENTIILPQTLQTEVTTFSFASVAEGAAITIQNAADASYSGKIIIEIPENETIPTVTANIPDGEVYIKQGTVTKLVTSSADNTTIIGAKAMIGTLIVQKGNVRIEDGGKVTTIQRSEDNQEMVYVIYESATAPTITLGQGVSLVSAAEFDLRQAAKNGGTYTLTDNVTLSDILVIENPLVLDGNGKTLTSTAGRAINVSGADGVTIKNLTINATGERAINIIQSATNVTIDHVIAKAANYTVNVAGSAPSAKVEIKNSTLTGLCTVNVSAASADVKVDSSTIYCNDNNTTVGESYSALSLNKEAVNGKITATNTTINVVEGSDSFKGRNGAENGTVTINGSTDGVVIIVAYITYPGSDYYHAFATLAKAVEFAKEGDVINLLRDITLEEGLIIRKDQNLTIDLNGHTINAGLKEEGRHHYAIDNYGTLVIEGTGAINARGIENFGTMTINGDIIITNIDTNGGAAIWNEGTLTINKGTFTTNTTAGADSYGAALNTRSGGVAVVNGGNFSAYSQLTYAIINEGTTTINNAVVKGKHGAVSGSGGTTFIKDGSFELMENPDISDHCTYMVSEITGGKFTLGNNTDSGAQLFYSSIVAEGYKTIVENGWTKVVKE